jgi:hypothetical protein
MLLHWVHVSVFNIQVWQCRICRSCPQTALASWVQGLPGWMPYTGGTLPVHVWLWEMPEQQMHFHQMSLVLQEQTRAISTWGEALHALAMPVSILAPPSHTHTQLVSLLLPEVRMEFPSVITHNFPLPCGHRPTNLCAITISFLGPHWFLEWLLA